MAYFDVDPVKQKSKKKNEKNEGIQNYVLEQIENWAEIMRGEINIKDYPNGWFGKHLRCAQGQDIYGWILEHVEEDQKKGGIICQKMLEKGLISAVEDTQVRIFNINNLYRFYMDKDDIADNQVKKWSKDVGEALECSINLV